MKMKVSNSFILSRKIKLSPSRIFHGTIRVLEFCNLRIQIKIHTLISGFSLQSAFSFNTWQILFKIMQLLKSIQMDIWRDGSVDGLVQIKTRHKSYKTAPFLLFFPASLQNAYLHGMPHQYRTRLWTQSITCIICSGSPGGGVSPNNKKKQKPSRENRN